MEVKFAGHFKAGNAGLQKGLHGLKGNRVPLGALHRRNDHFAELRMGRADNRAIIDLGHINQRGFNFRREDIRAAGNNHVLLPVADEEILIFVEIADIADGGVFAVTLAFDIAVRVGIGEVAKLREEDIDGPRLPRRQFFHLVIENFDRPARENFADRARLLLKPLPRRSAS